MHNITESIVINASRDAVLRVITEPQHILNWFVGLDTFEPSDDYPQVGSTMKWSYKVMGITFSGTNTMLEYDPNGDRKVELTGLINGTQHYQFADVDGGVELTITTDYEMAGGVLGKLAQPVVHRTNVNNSKKGLEALKQLAENL